MSPSPAILTWPRPVGGAWTPADLTLVAWFDASDATTITSSGGLVSQWADKSGNGYHVAQSDGGLKPSTGTRTQNSLNVLDFTPNDQMSVTSLTIASPVTVAIVARFDAIRSDGSVVVALRSGGGYAPAALSAPTPDQWWIRGTTSIQGDGGGAPGASAAFQATTVLDGASSLLRIDGTQRLSGNAGTTTGDRIHISGHGVIPSVYGIDGYVCEVVIASGALTGGDLTSLETYLSTKWGI